MTTICVNPLNLKDVEKARYKLLAYKKSLAQFPDLYIKEISRAFNEILKGQAPPLAQNLWSSYTIASGGGFGSDNEFGESSGLKSTAVFVFEGRVEFIEFGTGVIGKNQHGGINTEWLDKLPPPYTEYNRGPQIVHFDDENKDYWVYFDEGRRQITHGQPANPFIYRSVKELLNQYVDIAKNVFHANNIGKDFKVMG